MPTEATPFTAVPDEIRGYRIRALLGAGAMGAVYRAVASGGRRGLESGTEVALKILDPRYAPDANIVRRFKREAGVGLGAVHPGIARVHEIGSLRTRDPKGGREGGGRERRLHYIVQELLYGGSLQSRLELEGPQPEPVIREVGRQVAETLAFVHGRNIVHRDLKPANLFLDERGLVKVVDFGLARLIDETAAGETFAAEASTAPPPSTGATSSGKFLGTVAYAAPEQLLGAAATPQSDLFALGLVLHEMATGAHPFARERDEGFDAYVHAVQSRDAPPLSALRPDVSWFLDRVVQRLLERDLSRRFAGAEGVAEAFALGERSQFWAAATAPSSPFVSRGRRALEVRRPTRLLGRSRELAELTDEARAAFAGETRRVVVEGEEGVGKSRLVDALLEWVERSGPRVRLLVLRGGERPGEELAGEIDDLLFDSPRAGDVPLLFVLDGAEKATAATVELVSALATKDASRPRLFVITRSTEAPPPPGSASAIARLEQGATRIALQPLEPAPFAPIARDLGIDARSADRAARRLHELAAGNPGVAIELWSRLMERARVDALSGRRTPIPSLPATLSTRYARRLAPVDPAERSLLEAAAVLGAGLRTQTLSDILGLGAASFDERLVRLEARGLVERQGGEIHFREPLLRRHLISITPRERRRGVHLLAARHYQRELALAHPPPRTALKAAFHADLAQERPILAATLRPAARVLELEGALERAWKLVSSAERTARLPPQDDRLLAQALVLRGQLAHRLGHREDERAIWSEAAKLAAQLSDPALRAHASHGLGRLASRTGRFLEAETLFFDADRAAEQAPRGSGVERSLILLDLAEALLWSGDEERAFEALGRAEQVIDAGAAMSSIGRYFKERGNLLLELERFDEAGESFAQGRAIVRGPALRPLHRALVLGSARLLREIADYDRARRACRIARESAEADLDLRHLAQAWYLHGDLESRAGDPDAAFGPYVKSLRLARKIDDDYLEVSALGSLSFLYRWKRFKGHSLPKAVRCARRAIAKAHRLAVGRLEARGLAALALCYRDMKKSAWALAIARKAVREASAAGVRRRRAAEIYWVHGLICGEVGDREAARASLDEARRRIERRLLGVASPAVRSRMMEHDPLLREIEATRF